MTPEASSHVLLAGMMDGSVRAWTLPAAELLLDARVHCMAVSTLSKASK